METVKKTNYDPKLDKDANRDPLSGEVGSHPIGTGLGTLSGAAAGAVIGSAAGPVGTIAGAVAGTIIGGVAGAYAGKGIAEFVNPTEVNDYWSKNYASRPYVNSEDDYETYKPAYNYGYDARTKYADKKFDDIESDLSKNWNSQDSTLEWENAKEAVRDSYDYTDRIYRDRLNNKK